MADYEHPGPNDPPLSEQDLAAFREVLSRSVPTPPQLAEDPGPLPHSLSGGDAPFHQYLIAVGATGVVQREQLARVFHDLGMSFAHTMGLEPIMAVGYVSPEAHRPDYLSAATVWHTQLSKDEHVQLAENMPKFYMALELLFGRADYRRCDMESSTDLLMREIMSKWIEAIGGMDWYNAGVTVDSQRAQFHGRALAAVLDAVFRKL